MNAGALFGVVLACCGLLAFFFTKRGVRIVGPSDCTVDQTPQIFERLKQEGKDASFVVFIFQPAGKADRDDAVNIQFSVENGRAGLDWCLLGSTNVDDKDKFQRFVTAQGYEAELKELNGVKYLRVEQGDLPRLCQKVITELYGLGRDVELDMVVEGFSWP